MRPAIPPLDEEAGRRARARQDRLVKPRGSLGRLEELAVRLASMVGSDPSAAWPPAVLVFAADHGIARRGVSAFPQEVTAQMVGGYLAGAAAINVLARRIGADLRVVDVGVASAIPDGPGLVRARVREGTRDMLAGDAMTPEEVDRALAAGAGAVAAVADEGCGIVAVGDMGIGNTTASAAVGSALTGVPAAELTGRGTGLDDEGLRRKTELVERALARRPLDPGEPLDLLAAVGGLEIAALAGAILTAAARRLPVVLDGFITAAAALVAVALVPPVSGYLIASHRSAEAGHARLLDHLELEPLLDLGMRLGEGSGAALALSLVDAAIRLHGEMATFEEAGVSEGPEERS